MKDAGLTPQLGRSPGEGIGKPLQCSCLENPVGRGAWQATVHEVANSQGNDIWHHDNLLLMSAQEISHRTCDF